MLSTTIWRPELTMEEKEIIGEVDQIINEFQNKNLTEHLKCSKFWLKKLDHAEKIIQNVCHITYQRVLYQQAGIAEYRYDNETEKMIEFFEKVILVPIIDIQIPNYLLLKTDENTGEVTMTLKITPSMNEEEIWCTHMIQNNLQLLALSQLTYFRIQAKYAEWLSSNYIYNVGNVRDNESLLKGRKILNNFEPILKKMFGPNLILIKTEFLALKANFHLKFLEIKEAEICMEKYKKLGHLILELQPQGYWITFRLWSNTLIKLCRFEDSPFYENKEFLHKILDHLELCLKYNGNQINSSISILYAEVYLMLGKLKKSKIYLDQAFELECAQNSHCSVQVRFCYELYEKLYAKKNKIEKQMKCLTKIWQITTNLNDKCACYLENVEHKMSLLNVKGKWNSEKLFLKRCSYKFCDKIESKPREFQKCAQCRIAYYCSKKHQIKDWKKGGHKKICKPCRHV